MWRYLGPDEGRTDSIELPVLGKPSLCRQENCSPMLNNNNLGSLEFFAWISKRQIHSSKVSLCIIAGEIVSVCSALYGERGGLSGHCCHWSKSDKQGVIGAFLYQSLSVLFHRMRYWMDLKIKLNVLLHFFFKVIFFSCQNDNAANYQTPDCADQWN